MARLVAVMPLRNICLFLTQMSTGTCYFRATVQKVEEAYVTKNKQPQVLYLLSKARYSVD